MTLPYLMYGLAASSEDGDPSYPHRQPGGPCTSPTGCVGGDQRGPVLQREEAGLSQTSTGAAEPGHCPGPRKEAPSGRGYHRTLTPAVSGKTGAAIRPVSERPIPLASGKRRGLHEVVSIINLYHCILCILGTICDNDDGNKLTRVITACLISTRPR